MGELYHHGVLGMRWGVRRYQPYGEGGYTPKKKPKKAKKENHPDYSKAHDKKPVSQMSDQELRERNNRLQAEQQYASLTRKKSKGMQAAKTFIKVSATLVGIQKAAQTYSKYGNMAVEKIGDWVMSDLAKHMR